MLFYTKRFEKLRLSKHLSPSIKEYNFKGEKNNKNKEFGVAAISKIALPNMALI